MHDDTNGVAPSSRQPSASQGRRPCSNPLKACWTRLQMARRLCRKCMSGVDHAMPEPGGIHHTQLQLHVGKQHSRPVERQPDRNAHDDADHSRDRNGAGRGAGANSCQEDHCLNALANGGGEGQQEDARDGIPGSGLQSTMSTELELLRWPALIESSRQPLQQTASDTGLGHGLCRLGVAHAIKTAGPEAVIQGACLADEPTWMTVAKDAGAA